MEHITADNYTEVAKAFLATRKSGALIALNPGKKGGTDFEAQVGPWGAWRAYWKRIGFKQMVGWMDRYGPTPNACLTVPTLWPSDFDMAQANVQDDHRAGEAFRRNYRPPSAKMADAALRAITVANYRKAPPPQRAVPTNSTGE
jgi:hypothetical protein